MIRKFTANAALFFFSLAFSLLIAEVVVRFAMFTDAERKLGAEKVFDEFKSDFVKYQIDSNKDGKCMWSDMVRSHPYLGWVKKTEGNCAQKFWNEHGIHTKGVPLQKDQSKYTVLILGGSVANQLGRGKVDGKIWLEEILNRDYISPNGRPFQVLTAADGAWKFPTQNIAMTLYGNWVDAAIAIDGFNEAMSEILDMPDVGLFMRLTRESNEESKFINYRTLKFWRDFSLKNPVLRTSFFAAAIHRYQMQKVGMTWEEAKALSPFRNIAFPESMSEASRVEWNLDQMKYYIRLLTGQATMLGLKFAHFMQPIPAYSKPLTPEEQRRARFVTKEKYLPMLEANAQLAKEGLPAFSLAEVFRGHSEEIYGDEIHCIFDHTGDSPGYRLISERIAEILGKEWRLRRR